MADRTLRPIVSLDHADEREHRRQLAIRANAALPKDGTEGMVAPLRLFAAAFADLPDASLWPWSIAVATDLGALCVSDGNAWVPLAAGE